MNFKGALISGKMLEFCQRNITGPDLCQWSSQQWEELSLPANHFKMLPLTNLTKCPTEGAQVYQTISDKNNFLFTFCWGSVSDWQLQDNSYLLSATQAWVKKSMGSWSLKRVLQIERTCTRLVPPEDYNIWSAAMTITPTCVSGVSHVCLQKSEWRLFQLSCQTEPVNWAF